LARAWWALVNIVIWVVIVLGPVVLQVVKCRLDGWQATGGLERHMPEGSLVTKIAT
jgi:hypothetical protein